MKKPEGIRHLVVQNRQEDDSPNRWFPVVNEEASEGWRTVESPFVDQPGERWLIQNNGCLDVSVFDDVSQAQNRDIPVNRSFVDMGLISESNQHLEHAPHEGMNLDINPEYADKMLDPVLASKHREAGKMNSRDFRERCEVRNGRLYALYEKRAVDMQPPKHLRVEWLADVLDISFEQIDIAFKLVEAFKRIHRNFVLKIIYGYGDKSGLIKFAGHPQFLARYADLLEDWMQDPEIEIDQPVFEVRSFSDFSHWSLIYTGVLDEPDILPEELDEATDESWEDELERGGDSNPYSSFPLSDRTESLPHALINWIKSASKVQLKDFIQELPSKEGPYRIIQTGYGRSYRRWRKFNNLRPTQVSQAWDYIKDRFKALRSQ